MTTRLTINIEKEVITRAKIHYDLDCAPDDPEYPKRIESLAFNLANDAGGITELLVQQNGGWTEGALGLGVRYDVRIGTP